MTTCVNIDVVEIDGQWYVEARIDGLVHDRIKADSREEARAMHADLLKMAQETGGTIVYLNDFHARRN